MLQIAICDDNKKVIGYIKNIIYEILKKQDEKAEIHSYIGGMAFWKAINENKRYDILFLDLYMPDLPGLDLGTKMRYLSPETLIIIVSNREDYVFESFKMNPFRFIRKQRFKEEIEDVMLEALNEIREQNQPFWIHTGMANYCLYVKKILWIESHDKQIEIIYPKERISFRYKISDIEKELNNMGFLKIHRSILINVHHIQSINKNEILMDNGQTFIIAKKQLDKVRERMQNDIW
ncbi:MAG: LytTR family DNA-binding domain-containing protein [Eubacteriales bacterium]|nr:LytTR family DNA-binding domain-containing protein [Eubacteriales bacterium]